MFHKRGLCLFFLIIESGILTCLLMHLISYSDCITKVPLSACSVFTGCAGQFVVGIGLPALSKIKQAMEKTANKIRYTALAPHKMCLAVNVTC